MTAADIDIARLLYLASALGFYLFTSFLLRGLWRPLRFLLLGWTLALLFTPYFVDGRQDYVVPAFIVMANDLAEHRHDPQPLEAARRAGTPIAVVAGLLSLLALVLAVVLPKPARPAAAGSAQPARNPYLPDDFEPDSPAS